MKVNGLFPLFMKSRVIFILLLIVPLSGKAQINTKSSPVPGFETRISNFVDSLRIVDTHEHLFPPEILKGSYFFDFMMLFQPNGQDDLKSAGMPGSLFDTLYNSSLTPLQKWKFVEPYWRNSFNTSSSRIILQGIRNLYGISELNETTVSLLSEKIKKAYSTNWFDQILRDSCRIGYIIQDGYYQPGRDDYFRYAKRFCGWLTVRSKYRIDSLAISQLEPIYTLEDFVKSMRLAFEKEVKGGMTVVKVFAAYSRTLNFERIGSEAARKVFRSLVNGNEDLIISHQAAKPLQDYMFFQLMDLADEYNVPVAFHTGLQAGTGNYINNSNPTLLTNVFNEYPDINFVLYHGSYPFGGVLATLAKNFKNVYLDMNWTYSISPEYTERYLNEWLETVPVARIIAFGGDCMVVENVYSELLTARKIISKVLSDKVRDDYFTEDEAKTIAKMILHDNAVELYNLR